MQCLWTMKESMKMKKLNCNLKMHETGPTKSVGRVSGLSAWVRKEVEGRIIQSTMKQLQRWCWIRQLNQRILIKDDDNDGEIIILFHCPNTLSKQCFQDSLNYSFLVMDYTSALCFESPKIQFPSRLSLENVSYCFFFVLLRRHKSYIMRQII